MKKISWCKKQTYGIKLTEANYDLSNEYYQNAIQSLRVLERIYNTESNMWLATTKYYIEYFAVYAVLVKIGITSEIHDCTISLVKFLEKENIINKGVSRLLQKDKELRIDNQYYLKNKPVNVDFEKLSEFIISMKETLDNLDKDKIMEIRKKIVYA